MIGVLTFFRARPERLAPLIDVLQGVIAPGMDNPACLAMHLHADPDDACRLMIYEQWVSKTDFDTFGALPQFQWYWNHRLEFLEQDLETFFFNVLAPADQTAAAPPMAGKPPSPAHRRAAND